MATAITDRQAEVLKELMVRYFDGMYALTINPREAYPARNNEDSAKRRTLDQLARAGLLEHDPSEPAWAIAYRLVLPAAREAWESWYRRRGFKLD